MSKYQLTFYTKSTQLVKCTYLKVNDKLGEADILKLMLWYKKILFTDEPFDLNVPDDCDKWPRLETGTPSNPICGVIDVGRFLANHEDFNLYSQECDTVIRFQSEILISLNERNRDGTTPARKENYNKEIKDRIKQLTEILKSNKGGFYTGHKPIWADFSMAYFVRAYDNPEFLEGMLSSEIHEAVEKVLELPELKQHVKDNWPSKFTVDLFRHL